MLTSVTLNIVSCGHGNVKIPAINIKTWAGSYREGAILRAQDNAQISCRDSQFDGYVAMSYEDLKKIFNVLLLCKEWPPEAKMMDSEDILINNDDVYREYGRKVGY